MENEIRPSHDKASEVRGRLRKRPVVLAALIVLFAIVALIVYWAVWADRAPSWTGFGAYDEKAEGPRAKTLWDWLELLIIPAVLALGALWVNYTQKNTEIILAEQARQQERQIATDRQQEAALAAYYDRMTDLLLNHGLRESVDGAEVRSIVRAITLAVLRGLDGGRRTQAFRFLFEARLIESLQPVVDLAGADLSETDLSSMKLSGMNLSAAWLVQAKLISTDLTGADLSRSNLSGATLVFAKLDHAYLDGGVDLGGADLTNAKLRHTNMSSAKLANAKLADADLSEANLAHADLKGANMFRVNLTGADLPRAELNQANLRGANLTDADLGGAKLAGASLYKAALRRTDLRGATYTSATQWPKGFDPQAAGAQLTKERPAPTEE